jgi:hypothetical protein
MCGFRERKILSVVLTRPFREAMSTSTNRSRNAKTRGRELEPFNMQRGYARVLKANRIEAVARHGDEAIENTLLDLT